MDANTTYQLGLSMLNHQPENTNQLLPINIQNHHHEFNNHVAIENPQHAIHNHQLAINNHQIAIDNQQPATYSQIGVLSPENELFAFLKGIDEENAFYVMPLIQEQNITYNQFKIFGRHNIEKLFEIGRYHQIRQLGREVEFIEKFSAWKSSQNLNNACADNSNANLTSLSNGDTSNYTLNHVFENNPILNDLKEFYNKNGSLGETEQRKLTAAIIDFFVSKKIKLNSSKLQNLAAQIVKLFPNESEKVYFVKEKKQKAKGKLFYKYQNTTKLTYKQKPIQKSYQYMEKKVSFVGNEQDASAIKSILKYNYTDKEQTCQRWKQCIEYRLKELIECKDANVTNIIQNWPAYKQSFGSELVSIDFEVLYPQKNNNFYLNWEKLNNILPAYLNMNIKDTKLKSIWCEAQSKWSQLSQNSKDAVFIYVIHGVLKPERRTNERGKATIADSLISTIQFIDKDIQLDLYSGFQPFIAIKKDFYNVEDIFVVLDQIIYKMDSVAAALALCFKIYQVFNFNYNTKCLNFWLFIQKVLFKIHLQCDIVGTSLQDITSFFERHD